MFEQSARVVMETTVLSPDVFRIVANPLPHVACLPHWSSEPVSLAAGAPVDRAAAVDEPDTAAASPTYLDPTLKRKLRQMFSLDDDRMMQRSQDHHHDHQQHQQQALPVSDVDGAATTKL